MLVRTLVAVFLPEALGAAVKSFLGQRYALAPIGVKRFAPAELAPFNESSLLGGTDSQVGTLGPRCMQHGSPRPMDISEDCLFASIYAPVDSLPASGAASVPVMVWIHGGGWTAGSGNGYNGTDLAANQAIVVVSINYRLGTLGFFASKELAAEHKHGATGGMNGLLDVITALRWVQDNIRNFGGDASRVTIAGESAGAEIVCNLLASPVAAGLFLRAIIESGPCFGGVTGWGTGPRADAFVASAAVAKNRTLKELRAIEDGYELLQGNELTDMELGQVPTGKVEDSIDGYVLAGHMASKISPTPAFDAFVSGKLNSKEVLIGSNSFDGLNTYAVAYEQDPLTHMMPKYLYNHQMSADWGADSDAVKDLYTLSRFEGNTNAAYCQPDGDSGVHCPSLETAKTIAKAGGKAFVYYFAYGPVCDDVALGFGTMAPYGNVSWASHGAEIPWVFGDQTECYRSVGERALKRTMQDFWGSFCRSGQPVSQGLVWTPFEPSQGNTMVLDSEPRMVDGMKAQDCAALHAINQSFWPSKATGLVV